MPQQVVDPAPLVARRADVLETMDEEPAMDVPDVLGATGESLPQRSPFLAEAHRMDHTQGEPEALRLDDDLLRVGVAHGDGNLHQGRLAVSQAA